MRPIEVRRGGGRNRACHAFGWSGGEPLSDRLSVIASHVPPSLPLQPAGPRRNRELLHRTRHCARPLVAQPCRAAGPAQVFVLHHEPLAGRPEASSGERCPRTAWTLVVAAFIEVFHAHCQRTTLALGNPRAHKRGPPRGLGATPDQGLGAARRVRPCTAARTWPSNAENELSAMTRKRCRGRRIGDLGTMRAEIAAWPGKVQAPHSGVR